MAVPDGYAEFEANDPHARTQRGPGDLAPAARGQGHGPVPGHPRARSLLHAVAAADEGALEAREAEEEFRQPRDPPAHWHQAPHPGGPPHGKDAHAAALQCECVAVFGARSINHDPGMQIMRESAYGRKVKAIVRKRIDEILHQHILNAVAPPEVVVLLVRFNLH